MNPLVLPEWIPSLDGVGDPTSSPSNAEKQNYQSPFGEVLQPAVPTPRPLKVLVLLPFAEQDFGAEIEALGKFKPPVEVTWIRTPPSNEPQIEVSRSQYLQADILFTYSTLPTVIDDAIHLAFIQLFTSGIDHIKENVVYSSTDISITKTTGTHGAQIAEWVFGTYLSLTHNLTQWRFYQRNHHWVPVGAAPLADGSSDGKTLGIFGYGCIGRHVARIGHGMGMKVHVYSRRDRHETRQKQTPTFSLLPEAEDPDSTIPTTWYHGEDKLSLHTFLASGLNLLVLCVPLTDITRGCIGSTELSILASGTRGKTYVSNVSRGELIDQNALIKYLKKPKNHNGIDGAMLDTTTPEPLPVDSELWGMNNVIITPHVSALGEGFANRAFMVLMENIKRYAEGKELLNLVKRDVGY